MSTRGYIGIRIDGKDQGGYSHIDSYPEVVGAMLLRQCKELKKFTIETMGATPKNWVSVLKAKARTISGKKNSDQDAGFEFALAKKGPGGRYLPKSGGFFKILSGKEFEDYTGFINGVMCEWAYVLNLDTMCLEVYRGMSKYNLPTDKDVPEKDRWGHEEEEEKWAYDVDLKNIPGRYARGYEKRDAYKKNGTYGTVLVKSFPLNRLPTTTEFIALSKGKPDPYLPDPPIEYDPFDL